MPPTKPESGLRLDPKALLADLKPLARTIEDDFARSSKTTSWPSRRSTTRPKRPDGTGHDFHTWREGRVAMSAASWILACVLVRFIEDNRLVPEAHLTSPDPEVA